jgi:photosystem II stability/assembly factor-like uncharacterized protein
MLAAQSLPSTRKLIKVAPLPDQAIRGIEFSSSKIGWILGDRHLWFTIDAGSTWRPLNPSSTLGSRDSVDEQFTVEPRYFGFFADSTGWIQWNTNILRSSDTGTAWSIQGSLPIHDPAEWSLYSLSFSPRSSRNAVGWSGGAQVLVSDRGAVSSRVTVYRTSDGGQHWTPQPFPAGPNVRGLTIHAVSESRAVAGTASGMYNMRGSGANWEMSTVDSKGYSQSATPPANFFFLDEQRGWAGYQEGMVLNTVDGGRTWHVVVPANRIWPAIEGIGNFGRIYFQSTERGWILGGDGAVYELINGGDQWRKIDSPEFMHDLYCKSASRATFECWAVGETSLWRLQ